MPRATLLLPVYQLFSMLKGSASERVEVRRNPGQHTQDTGAIEGHELRLLLARGAQIDHDVVLMFQSLQPRNTPAKDLHFVGQGAQPEGRRSRWVRFRVSRVYGAGGV